jgi:hypothetical protein
VNPLGPVNGNEFPFTPEGKPLPARYSFTLQGYHGKIQTNAESYNPSNSILTPVQTTQTERTTTAGADFWYQNGPVIAFGEFYWRSLRPESTGNDFNSIGIWGQVIVNAYKNLIGVGARVNWIDPNLNLTSDQATEVEGQVAWFIQPPDLVLKLRYAWLQQLSPDAQTLGSFQLPFIAGTSNLATLQLTLSF